MHLLKGNLNDSTPLEEEFSAQGSLSCLKYYGIDSWVQQIVVMLVMELYHVTIDRTV